MAVFTATDESQTAGAIRRASQPLPEVDDAAFMEVFDRFGDARVVLLGECTHGTSEFYRARAAISSRLIERHGFRIVAIEGDWPDVAELDRFARNRGVWGRREVFVNFPRWMWRNAEFATFVRELRTWNLHRDPADRAELRGLDVYSLPTSVAEVLSYLDRIDPDAALRARRRYSCLRPFLDQPQRYGLAAQLGAVDCEDEIVAQLVALLERRNDYARKDGEDFFDAEQNARVVASAETYYRAMYRGSVESWNLRDSHMFETLKRLMERRGPDSKAIVWAHNSHIGNAAATAMGVAGEFNIGQLCREAFGDRCIAIGFGTDRGKVAAADEWGGSVRIKDVRPSRPHSWESMFLEAASPRSLIDWRHDASLADTLDHTRRQRAIGVIYRPDTEIASHYFEACISRQFDAYVWFDETSAVSPMPAGEPEGAPDTYPFGL